MHQTQNEGERLLALELRPRQQKQAQENCKCDCSYDYFGNVFEYDCDDLAFLTNVTEHNSTFVDDYIQLLSSQYNVCDAVF